MSGPLPLEAYEALRRAARESLAVFARVLWNVVNPGVEMLWNWHLDAICEHLEAVTRREIHSLVISLPPGSCKSTIVCQAWPCWEWLFFPERRWLFATNSLENARKDATYRRAILLSEIYKDLEPQCVLARSGKRVQVIRNELQGEMRAISTGSSITGAHFDCQCIDDPNDAQRCSPEELAGVAQWYDEVLSTRVRDNAATVIIQQRLATHDLAGHLLDLGVDAEIVLPAAYVPSAARKPTPLGWVDPRTKPGQLLWPERFDGEYLRRRRKILGPLAFSAQYQQQPRLEGGAVYQAKWWRRHNPEDVDPCGAGLQWLMVADTAMSLRDSADLTVLQVWALDAQARAWMVEQRSGHWEVVEQVARVKALFARYPLCRRVAIEEQNGGWALCSALKPELERVGRSVWRWKSQTPKVARIESVASLVEGGMVSVVTGQEGDDLINQASEFPQGRHDDMIDAAAMALSIWQMRIAHGSTLDELDLAAKAPAAVHVAKGTTIRTGAQREDKKPAWKKRLH